MIHLVVALIHEARPVIDHYRLRRLCGNHPYVIYSNTQFRLIVSGVGKVSSAAATAYLQALSHHAGPVSEPVAWLNLGIAGHSHFEVGEGFLAHRIINQTTGYAYYPPLIFRFPLASSDLITVESEEKDYAADSGYDMEASAYYKIALLSTTIEWVHCYKVVSDNLRHPIEKITKTDVGRLILTKMHEVTEMLSILSDELTAYRQLELPDSDLEPFLERWHFSETQKLQLKTLLRRGRTLYGEKFLAELNPDDHKGAKYFLKALKQKLHSGSSLNLGSKNEIRE